MRGEGANFRVSPAEPYKVLTVKIGEKFPHMSGRERGKVTILKYDEHSLFSFTGPIFHENYFTRV